MACVGQPIASNEAALPLTTKQDKVTCVGQPIAIVAADTEAAARAGAKAVVVEYEDLPAVLDIDDAIAGRL